MGPGAAAAIQLLLGLLDRAAVIGGLINQAQSEGRDVTTQELDQLRAQDDAARNRLQAAIDRKLAGGGD